MGCQPSTEFEVVPAALLGERAKRFKYDTRIAAAKDERIARVRKGKADSPAACKGTCYLRERKQYLWFAMARTVETKRFVAVCLA
jgi:hypothetical protein